MSEHEPEWGSKRIFAAPSGALKKLPTGAASWTSVITRDLSRLSGKFSSNTKPLVSSDRFYLSFGAFVWKTRVIIMGTLKMRKRKRGLWRWWWWWRKGGWEVKSAPPTEGVVKRIQLSELLVLKRLDWLKLMYLTSVRLLMVMSG